MMILCTPISISFSLSHTHRSHMDIAIPKLVNQVMNGAVMRIIVKEKKISFRKYLKQYLSSLDDLKRRQENESGFIF